MTINSINKFIQQLFLKIPLKIVQSTGWTALAILAFPSFIIDRKYSSFFAKKAVAIWNENESSTITKVDQAASSIKVDRNSFEAILDQWTKEDPTRIGTQQRILEFFTSNKKTALNLSSSGLTSLPEIFQFEPFLSKLQTLMLEDNQLTILPESFSNLQALTFLNLNRNSLVTLPESFGNLQALRHLYFNGNSLVTLPESFGNLQALIFLFLRDNSLVALPESFGNLQALIILIFEGNSLVTLPESFGNLQALTHLNLQNNRTLSGLPMQILHLSRRCEIDLTGCNLSQTVLERIREITTNPAYAGPRISFSISDRAHREEKSIEESLKDLYSIANKPLINFPNLEKTSTLRSWLNRLSDIADYQKQGPLQKTFANTIIRYLELANEDLAFRDAFYAIIQDAAESCGDRMSLSILDLGIVHKLATIDLKDTKALSDFLIKGPWAIEMLKEIARNKIPALPFFDEIEVYLGYPIKLKEELNLPIDIQEMLYFTCSALNDKDLEEAKAFVLSKQENQEACFTFLIGHDKWKEALSVNYAEEYQAILDKKVEASELENPNYGMIEEKFNQELTELTKKALA